VLIAALRDDDAWVRYFTAIGLGRRREADAAGALAEAAAQDAASHVRIAAIDALGAIGGPRAVETLLALATSADRDLAAAALRALGGARQPAAAGVLGSALRSEDPVRRAAAAEGLAAFGGHEAIDALRWTASADQDPRVVSAALDGLAGLASRPGENLADAVQALAAVAAEPARRSQALSALAKLPPAAVPALEGVLRHADPGVRRVAVDALVRMARPPASTLLMRALDDPEPDVRLRAVDALVRLGTRGVGRRLADLARVDDSEAVRRVAAAALARTGGADAEREP
jgi:hypothetical protein